MKTVAFFFESDDKWAGERNYIISLITNCSYELYNITHNYNFSK